MYCFIAYLTLADLSTKLQAKGLRIASCQKKRSKEIEIVLHIHIGLSTCNYSLEFCLESNISLGKGLFVGEDVDGIQSVIV